jgi:Actin like proteins N terminal domain/Archaeal actin homologue MreB-like, C-terminal
MTRVLNLGFDRGNSRTNVAALTDTGSLVEIDASSMVSIGNIAKYRAIKSGSSASTAISNNELMVEYDGTVYFLSDFSEHGKNPTTDFSDLNRYGKINTKVSLMAFAALASMRIWPNVPVNDFAINLVMGVPLQAYREKSEDIVNQLTGSYHYFFNGREFSIHVDTVRVFMEGAGAAIYSGLDKSNTIGIVDSGSLTTNILRFDGMKANTEQCVSFDIGVNTALDKLDMSFEAEYGRNLSEVEKQQILHASIGEGNYPELYAEGRQVSGTLLHTWIKKAIADTGAEKNTEIAARWRDKNGKVASNYKKVLHVGGGAYYFHPSLQQIIKSAEQIEDAEKANARGYAVLADQIGQRRALKRA